MARRTLEYLPLDDLEPDPRNPKLHSIEDLRASASRFGYTEPILMDERTGRLVAGHGRRELLLDDKAAGRAAPEGVTVDGNRWLVPVIRGWASADDTEALAYVIASNRLPEKAGWEPEPLLDALDRLGEVGALDGLGYTADELDDLIAQLGTITLPTEETDADFAPHTERAEREASTKAAQGLHEVGLIFQAEHFREYQELHARLRRQWGTEATPELVLRALREAAQR